MGDTTGMLLHFIDSYLFTGYGLFTIFWMILLLFYKKDLIIIKLDYAANDLIVVIGLLYFALWMTSLFIALNYSSPQDEFSLHNRLFGPYAFGYWLPSSLLVGITQLLWFKTIRKLKVIRIILGFFMCFSFEKFTIFLVSLHRDYLPPAVAITVDNDVSPVGFIALLFIAFWEKLMLYLLLTSIYYIISLKFKKSHLY